MGSLNDSNFFFFFELCVEKGLEYTSHIVTARMISRWNRTKEKQKNASKIHYSQNENKISKRGRRRGTANDS